jgi:hypothetical protein
MGRKRGSHGPRFGVSGKDFLQQTDGREETCKGLTPQGEAGLFGEWSCRTKH